MKRKNDQMKPQIIKDIIAAVRKHSDILDNRSPDAREELWEIMSKETNISPEQLKRNWRIIRERYVREHRLVHLGKIKRNEVKFRYYDSMDFLDPYIKRRNIFNRNISVKTEEENIKPSISDEDMEFETEKSYSKENKSYREEFVNDYEDTSVQYIEEDNSTDNYKNISGRSFGTKNNNYNQPETADDLFCKMLSISLKSLNRVNNIKAKTEMLQIVQKYVEVEEDKEY